MGGLRLFALASLAAVAAHAPQAANAAACNISAAASEYVYTVVDHSSFKDVPVKTIIPATIDQPSGVLFLAVQEPTGGVPSYMWLLDNYRVANDFAATVDFAIAGEGGEYIETFQIK
jgi:hypothetical protein